jgi:hypothetical protein
MSTFMTTPFSYLGNFFNKVENNAQNGMLVSEVSTDTLSREVVRPLWTVFLDDFTRRNHKRPVSIYTCQFGGAQRVRASGVPLEKVALDIDYGHKNFVHIQIAPQAFGRGVNYMFSTRSILELLDDTGKQTGLIFDASNGVQTLLHF